MDKNFNLLSNTIEDVFAKHNQALAGYAAAAHAKGKKKISKKDLELALTILLVELASCDQSFDQPEYHTIVNGLKRLFGTDRTAVTGLINQANLVLSNLRGSSKFATMLKENLTLPQRECILEVIQEIIDADGKIDGFELYLKMRLSELLGIPVSQSLQAK